MGPIDAAAAATRVALWRLEFARAAAETLKRTAAGCLFAILAPFPAAGRRLFLLQTSSGAVPLIFAAGNLRRDGSLQEHFDKGSANLPLLATSAGGGAGGDVVEDGTNNSSLKAVSAGFMNALHVRVLPCIALYCPGKASPVCCCGISLPQAPPTM